MITLTESARVTAGIVLLTIVNLVIWGVVFPALVTGLIAFAAIRAIGERQDNAENDKRHRRRT